jgi:putative ABC transport system permease protein
MLTLMHNYSLPLFERNGVIPPPQWEEGSNVWLKLNPGINTDAFNAKQAAFVEQEITRYNDSLGPGRKISDHFIQSWQPLSEIHFNPHTREIGPEAGDPMRVAAVALIGLLVLLVGCSNSVSLSLVAALARRREIGVRKAAGALPHEIMQQQLAESVHKALLALLPALAALELLASPLEALLPSMSVDPSWIDLALLAVIALCVGLVCGVYPALVLSGTRPQSVLRAGAQPGLNSGMNLRTALVGAQFCVASLLLIVTSALYVQLAVTRAQPLGFDADNLILLERNEDGDSMPALRAELEQLPGVTAVVQGATLPPNADLPINFGAITLVANLTDTAGIDAQEVSAGPDFIDFMRMRILAGRGFDAALDAPPAQQQPIAPGAEPPLTPIVINEAAARELGLTPEQAVNFQLHQRARNRRTGEVMSRPLRVVGVMEDNLYISLRRRAGPIAYFPTGGARSILLLRYDDASESTIQQAINDTAQRVHGKPLRAIDFLEPQIDATFMTERNEGKLLLICGALALVLASIGLYGLAAFAVERQVKEVGVRKVLGASVGAIVGLFVWRFARPIVLANIVAWPFASYFIVQWIQRFPYQMEPAWLAPLCIATLAMVLLIALLTVSTLTTRAATVNPVRSLRYE